MLGINRIRTDGGTQAREAINRERVVEYADRMQEGDQFPPVIVFDDGSDIWLADGFHRVQAAREANLAEVAAEIIPGSLRDAVLYAVGSNARHGVARTNADKRHAVELLLRDPEWSQWSDREIARRVAVHHQMVAKARRDLSGGIIQIAATPTKKCERNGTVYEQKPKSAAPTEARRPHLRAGKKPRAERAEEIQALALEGNSARQIAEAIGIGVKHVRDIAKEKGIQLPDAIVGKVQRLNVRRVIEETCNGLSGYAQGLSTIKGAINGISPAEAADWSRELSASLKQIGGFVTALRAVAHPSGSRTDPDELRDQVRAARHDASLTDRAAQGASRVAE